MNNIKINLLLFISLLILSACHSVMGERADASQDQLNDTFIHSYLEQVPLFGKKLEGVVQSGNEPIWLIVSGRECENCDQNLSLYLFNTQKPPANLPERYGFPGKIFSWETDSLEYESSVFWGECDEEPGSEIVWFQHDLTAAESSRSIYWISFANDTLSGKILPYTETIENLVLGRSAKNFCKEIFPLDQSSEP